MLFARNSVAHAAETDDAVSEGAVVHVDRARPRNATRIDSERVPLMDVVVEHRREQRVRARDRVEIAGEVQIDIVHRHHLREPAARRAAFDTEHGSQTRLPNAQRDLLAHAPQRLRESHRHGALALAGRRRVGRGDDDETSLRWPRRNVERNLGLVLPVEVEIVAPESELGGHVLDGAHLHLLGDLDVGWNGGSPHGVSPLGRRSV